MEIGVIGKDKAEMATKTSENNEPGAAEGEGAGSKKAGMNKDSVGRILRQAREARGNRSIAEIAEEIRVRPHQLEALEADDYDRLPGLIYAAGFIRAYAQYLGLDSEALVTQFKRTAHTEDLEAHLAFPEPLEDPRVPRRSLVAVACALAVAVYGAWYGFSSHEKPGYEDVPMVSSRLAGPGQGADAAKPQSESPQATTTDAHVSAKAETGLMGIAEANAAPRKRPAAESPKAVEPEVVASAETTPAPEPAAASKPTVDAGQITVRARQDAWVRIEGPGAKPVMDRVLKAGEAYDAPAGQGLYMMTGNAGALDIMVDGKHVGSLGPRGAIRRHVALDSTLLRTASAVRQE